MKSSQRYPKIWSTLLLFFALSAVGQDVQELKLKNYHPISIYKIPQTTVRKAKFPVIDLHSHDYLQSDAEVEGWLKTMDKVGIAKTVILSYSTGAKFDSIYARYAKYKDRFDIWC